MMGNRRRANRTFNLIRRQFAEIDQEWSNEPLTPEAEAEIDEEIEADLRRLGLHELADKHAAKRAA